MLFSCMLLCANASYSQESSQSIELKRYLTLESYLFKIPVEKNVLISQIIPQIESEKLSLATHFPPKDQLEGPYISQEQKEELLQHWINNYPGEYHPFISYLETLIRSYH